MSNPQPDPQPAPEKASVRTRVTETLRRPVTIRRIILSLVLLVVFLLVTNPALVPFLPQETKAELSRTWSNVFGDVSQVASRISLSWVSLFEVIAIILLMVFLTSVLGFILEHLPAKSGKAKSAISLLRSALAYVTAIIGFFWCLAALGVNVGTIFAGVGLVALIVGFGAQSLVEDLVTGIFLVFEDEFNVGDIIEVNGSRGTVMSIGIRTTVISEPGNNLKIINNGDLRNILNRSSENSFAVTSVSVSYDTDIEYVEKVLEELMPQIQEKYPDIFLSTPKNLGIQTLGESGVEFKVLGEVNDKDIFGAPRILNREIKIAFDKAGIEIPFTQVVVHEPKSK